MSDTDKKLKEMQTNLANQNAQIGGLIAALQTLTKTAATTPPIFTEELERERWQPFESPDDRIITRRIVELQEDRDGNLVEESCEYGYNRVTLLEVSHELADRLDAKVARRR